MSNPDPQSFVPPLTDEERKRMATYADAAWSAWERMVADGEWPEDVAIPASLQHLAPAKPADGAPSAFDLSNDWLYAWGDLPTTLDGLRAWLKAHDIAVEDFKNTARYEANLDRFPWLEDL